MAEPKPPTQRRYPAELRDRAVRLVLEEYQRSQERHGVVTRIAAQLGIGTESLRAWVRQADIDGGRRAGTTSADQRRITELEREVRELRRANEPQGGIGLLRAGTRPTSAEMTAFIDEHKETFGVESICRTLPVAPSTYYAGKSRPISARACEDAALEREIAMVHKANFGVYGVRKVWKALLRKGIVVGRDRVAPLMRRMGLQGVVRGKFKRTTVPACLAQRPGDLVNRVFSAAAPNALWVADLTYVATWAGFCYTAFIIDAFSRRIVGWRVSSSLRTDLALDALDMAIWTRQHDDLSGLVHHTDRGVQYLSIRYTERLGEVDAVASVGSKGDSYDNALAETVNGLCKAELIRRGGPWRSVDDVELATLGWITWWNTERLHSACAYVPPAEYEQRHIEAAAA